MNIDLNSRIRVKTDLHIHAKEDSKDYQIKYSAREIIDIAQTKGFKVLSFTFHDYVYENLELQQYAMKRGILLILGVERTIEGYHTLIYGITNNESNQINSFEDLRKLRQKKEVLVIAPHPFYPNILGHFCLGNKVFEHKDLFDAIEVQQLFTKIYNPNNKAILVAKQLDKALVANSDSHRLSSFGTHHTLIELPQNFTQKDVFQAIRDKKTEVVIKPMNVFQAFIFVFKHMFEKLIAKSKH